MILLYSIIKSTVEKYAKRSVLDDENLLVSEVVDSLTIINILLDLEIELNFNFDLSKLSFDDIKSINSMFQYINRILNKNL
jgi:acyl carrier protein